MKKSFVVISFLCMAVLFNFASEASADFLQTNLITNGDFNNGTTGWWLQNNSGSGVMSVLDGELQVRINNGGRDIYSLGIGQNTGKLEKKGIYKVTFEAHSDREIRLASFSQQSFSPWHAYSGMHYMDVSTLKKEFSYTFTMREPDDRKALFYFYFGKLGNATIYFDNISLVQIGSEGALDTPVNFPAPIKRKLYRGMTFGTILDAPYEGASGTEIRKEYFQLIRDKGFDHIRIPVSWSTHALRNKPYTIDPEFFERVDWVVGNTLSLGMHAVLDMHNFLELESNPSSNKEFFMGLWRQISEHYRNYPEDLYFEIYNEPCKNMNQIWNQYASEALQIIRASNSSRKVVIDVAGFAQPTEIGSLVIPNDTNLIVSFHFYQPADFCFQGMDWSGMGALSGLRWEGNAYQKKTLTDILDRVTNWSHNHNDVELWNGEFCAHYRADLNDRVRWTDFVARECEKRDIGWAYWDFHEESCGIYDPDTQGFRQEILNSLIPLP